MLNIIASTEAAWAAVAALAAAASAGLTAGVAFAGWRTSQRARVIVHTDVRSPQDQRPEQILVIENLGPQIAREVLVTVRQRSDVEDQVLPGVLGGADDQETDGTLYIRVKRLAPGQRVTRKIVTTFGTTTWQLTGTYSWEDTGKRSEELDTPLSV